MWAMMQKLRICAGGVAAGCRGVRERGDMTPGVYRRRADLSRRAGDGTLAGADADTPVSDVVRKS